MMLLQAKLRNLVVIAGLVIMGLIISTHFFILASGLTALAKTPQRATSPGQNKLLLQPDDYRLQPLPSFLKKISAHSIYVSLEDGTSWPILKHQIDQPTSLASLTKIMTALVFLDTKPDWNKLVTVQSSDQRGGARTPLAPGQQLTVLDLWTLSLISSDNDATAALVRSSSLTESEFVVAMNQKARDLGLTSTSFVEPTGLSVNNKGTARDIAILGRQALGNSDLCEILQSRQKTITISGRPYQAISSDLNIRDSLSQGSAEKFLCGKTGHITESGYNVVFKQYLDSRHTAMVVILGSTSLDQRVAEALALVDWAGEIVSKSPANSGN